MTHHHGIRGSELVRNKETFGLLGFGVRDTALNMDISTLFRVSTVKKHVPSLQQLLDCDTLEKLRELKPDVSTMNEELIDYSCILPPILTEELYDLEDMSAETVLYKFLQKIKDVVLTNQQCQEEQEESGDEPNLNEGVNEESSTAPQGYDDDHGTITATFLRMFRCL